MNSINDQVRIVVVDDVPDVAESLASFLRLNGHDVRTAASGEEALKCVAAFEPHCVMLDLGMPDMSGSELARRLRQRYGSQLVLIAVTGQAEIDLALAPEVRHVDHCLRKPLRVQELAKLLPLPRTNASGEDAAGALAF